MQIKIGAIGLTVEGIEDINQEIGLIIATPLGSIPHMPEFGSRIPFYLDKPQNVALPLIIAEVYRAIKKNSTRFKPSSVKLVSASPNRKMVFKISGILTDAQTDKEVILNVLADFTR
ncbi:GPW/gp25 family protein [Dissulfurispira sp.]|uniref:GPW/gp25 family protein n=1 Tax=Dissulfurispira sp. TaxID=2817609 RepID=UPI002FD94DB1